MNTLVVKGQAAEDISRPTQNNRSRCNDWAVEFDEIVSGWVDERDFASITDFHKLGELAAMAHPTYEHFLPLLYALGASTEEDELRWVTEGIVSGCHDMRSLLID